MVKKRKLHIWEHPDLHRDDVTRLPLNSPVHMVYEPHEYEWWRRESDGSLSIGIYVQEEYTDVDTQEPFEQRQRTRWVAETHTVIQRGMYAKVWEETIEFAEGYATAPVVTPHQFAGYASVPANVEAGTPLGDAPATPEDRPPMEDIMAIMDRLDADRAAGRMPPIGGEIFPVSVDEHPVLVDDGTPGDDEIRKRFRGFLERPPAGLVNIHVEPGSDPGSDPDAPPMFEELSREHKQVPSEPPPSPDDTAMMPPPLPFVPVDTGELPVVLPPPDTTQVNIRLPNLGLIATGKWPLRTLPVHRTTRKRKK